LFIALIARWFNFRQKDEKDDEKNEGQLSLLRVC